MVCLFLEPCLKKLLQKMSRRHFSPGLSDKGRSRKEVSHSQSLIDVRILKCFISSDLSWLTFLPSVGMGLCVDLLILQTESLLEKVPMCI